MSLGRTLLVASLLLAPATAFAETGAVVGSFPSSFPSPDGLAFDGEWLWATDCSTSRIDKVDPDTGEVVGSIDVEGVNSDELAWDGEALWVSDHTATEMPGMGAPPVALYRVDRESAQVLARLDPPGPSKYPMGLAWDGERLFNVDPWDRKVFVIEPSTGATIRTVPAPGSGACGMTYDGACLWVTDAASDGLVYHIDPGTGEVLRSFAGPGGDGHQSTGVAWDGANLWVHDEAAGRAKVYKLEIDDISEGGRCAGAFRTVVDAGVPDSGVGPNSDAGTDAPDDAPPAQPSDSGASSGCNVSATSPVRGGSLAIGLMGLAWALARFRNYRSSRAQP